MSRGPEQQAVYEHGKVPQWTSDVVEGVMKKLTGLQKPFKYIGALSRPPIISDLPCVSAC